MNVAKTSWGELERAANGSFRRESTRLTWRSDPVESLSDWTLQVVSDERSTADIQSYHVHRCILAASSGDYFKRLFGDKSSPSTITRIPLRQESARSAFPILLDFLYERTVDAISSENAVALRHLAHLFRIGSLLDLVNDFIQDDLNPVTASKYYLKQATQFEDELLVDVACAACASNLDIVEDTTILEIPPTLLHKIVRSSDLSADSLLLSRRMAQYLLEQQENCSTSQLQAFLSHRILPIVDTTASCTLLSIAQQRLSGRHLESLRERCVQSFSSNWQVAVQQVLQQTTKGGLRNNDYRDLEAETKLQLLEESLHVADKEATELRDSNEILEKQVADLRLELATKTRVESQLESARRTEESLRGEVWRLRSKLAAAKQFEAEANRNQQQQQQGDSFCFDGGLPILKPNLLKLSKQFLSQR